MTKTKITSNSRRRSGNVGLMIPMYVFTILFVALPILYLFLLSFYREHRSGVWTLRSRWTITKNIGTAVSGYFLAVSEAGIYRHLFVALIGYPYGYFMAKMNAVWKRRMLLLIMIPFWTSALIRLYGWIIVFRSNGVLDKILMGLHLTKQPLKLLYTYPAVVVGMVYSLLPFMILAVYSSAEKLDASLVEASRDLGASAWKAFWTVSFRLTLPGLLSGVVLSFIPSMGLFS